MADDRFLLIYGAMNKSRILIVDDDENITRLVTLVLVRRSRFLLLEEAQG